MSFKVCLKAVKPFKLLNIITSIIGPANNVQYNAVLYLLKLLKGCLLHTVKHVLSYFGFFLKMD